MSQQRSITFDTCRLIYQMIMDLLLLVIFPTRWQPPSHKTVVTTANIYWVVTMCGAGIISFNYHTNPLREVLSPIFRWENWGIHCVWNLPGTTLPINSPDEVQFLLTSLGIMVFYQLAPSRAVYPVCRNIMPNTQSTNSPGNLPLQEFS